MSAENEEVSFIQEGAVAVVTFSRPPMNVLSRSLMKSVSSIVEDLDRNPEVRCIILTGNKKVFAAGADIKEMGDKNVAQMSSDDNLTSWDRVGRIGKPIIAAVSGFALGGGCELALACDLIIASESAVFGQPEINLGVIPGAGGTQRLTRVLGKYRAMELILTGKRLSAREAFELGLVNRVYPVESYMAEAKKFALSIAAQAPLAAKAGKEAVLKALDVDIDSGLAIERRLFWSLFGTEDQKEGMRAFIEKRKPVFKGK